MENLNTLAVQIRETGEANGWSLLYRPDWTSSDHHVPALLALIHSEISEAHGAMHEVRNDGDLAAEFADILIRVLDLAGGLTEDFAAHVARIEGTLISADDERTFNSLHKITAYALEAFRDNNLLLFLDTLALILFSVEQWAAQRFEIDINVAVAEKMDVNRHRSYRHGGKRV